MLVDGGDRMRCPNLTSFGFLAWSLLLTSPTSAQMKGNPDYLCRNGYFPRESNQYRLAKIKGAAGERVYFHGDDNESCPDDQNCRLKTYVTRNDEVIVSRTFGKFACTWFQPRKGIETVGWIETDRLAWQKIIRPPAERDWLGEWRAYDNVIRISKSKEAGMLAIKGEATWGVSSTISAELGRRTTNAGAISLVSCDLGFASALAMRVFANVKY